MLGSTTRAEPRGAVRCTFCHAQFARHDGPFACGGCGGLLHEGCWYEAARCPTLGCPGPAARRRRPPRPPSPSPPARRSIGAGLHAVTLGLWLLWGLAALVLGGVWPLPTVVLLGWWLLVVGVQRGWRLDAPWLLVVSGLATGLALAPILGPLLR